MRLRTIILFLAIIAFFSATTGGILYYYSFRKAAFQKNEAEAYARMKQLTDQLSSLLSEHTKPVKTMASMETLQTVLKDKNLKTIYNTNQVLDRFTRTLDVEVSYLMDHNGVTLCSSNRNAKDSFVDKNFSFRPYFGNAIKGETATYLALGTTSLKRGVYHSYPVFDNDARTVLGVAVIKASIEFVESRLFPPEDDPLFFVSPNGVIFISNQGDMRFKLLWRPSDENIQQIEDSRQFGNGPWVWSGFSKNRDAFVLDTHYTKFLSTTLDVPGYLGWQLIYLRNYQNLEKQVSQPFVRIIGPVVAAVLFLTGGLVMALYRLGVREITRRKKAEEELRLSEERYRHIYHKTPVMLHSIDTEGRIIRVSDHWVEVMGYNREEVIGEQLIKFFTPESQQYAIKVVFPEFFSTGFCKDISYTYVKKNTETMDILLSCYGVRDDSGNIIRSLAVSVDVTEKNRTQQDLQVAKEKLSQYSQTLEQQVKKRTAQLEKAQDSLKKLSKNIIASQEREKALVARELHDHLGQVLTALRIDAVWAEKKLKKIDPRAGERALKMCNLIEDTINDVRDMAYRLRPRVLDDLGLPDALESLVTDFEQRSNVSCVFKHDPIPAIDDTVSTALYRIGQEAVTNALRHSAATSIHVELTKDNEGIVLSIEDNGCGFEPEQVQENEGFGLEGMRERANLVGGRLDIESCPGQGTMICCKIKVKG